MLAPHQLKHCTFVKLAPQSKNPNINGHGWNTNPAVWLNYNQLNQYLESTNGNYGIFTGDAQTVIVDLDGPQDLSLQLIAKLPITFTVESGSGGRYHLTYSVKDKDAFKRFTDNVVPLTHNNQHIGEIRFGNVQTVGPGSIHPNGNTYTVYREIDVAEITASQILDVLAPYFNHKKINTAKSVSSSITANPNSILPVINTLPNMQDFGHAIIGPHPTHGSTTGQNFNVWPDKNVWHCFRHNSGGNVFHLIAVLNNILNCEDCRPGSLSGPKFQQCVSIYKNQYGQPFKPFDIPPAYEHSNDFSRIFPETPWPREIFPDVFNEILDEYSQSFNVPPEIPGMIILTAVAGLIGRKVCVSVKPDFHVITPIWLAVIGSSGSGKTPITQHILRPLNRIQIDYEAQYQNNLDAYLAAKDSKRAPGQPPPKKPPHRKPLVSDVTCEKLAELMRDNPGGLLQHRDELSGLIRGMDAYRKQGQGKDIAFYLSTFNSETVNFDRVSGNIFVPHSSLGILGGLQTERLPDIFTPLAFETGFIQRFVFVFFPRVIHKITANFVPDQTSNNLYDLFLAAYNIELNNGKQIYFNATAKALDVYIDAVNNLRELIPYIPLDYQSFIPKFEYYINKFCAILHFIHKPIKESFLVSYKRQGMQPSDASQYAMITPELVEKAVKLTRFLIGKTAFVMDQFTAKTPPSKTDETVTKTLQHLTDKISLPALLNIINDKLPNEAKFKSEKALGKKLKLMNIKTEREWDKTQNKNVRFCHPIKEEDED